MSEDLKAVVLAVTVLAGACAVAVGAARLARAAKAGRGGALVWWLDEVRRAIANEEPKPRPTDHGTAHVR